MAESTEQLEGTILEERRDLSRNLHALERKAKALKDWRTYYQQYPLAAVGVAFGGAMVVGMLTRRSQADEHEGYPRGLDFKDRESDFRGPSKLSASTDHVKRQVGDTLDHIVEAVVGVATAKAIEFVGRRIPGFSDEYLKRHPH